MTKVILAGISGLLGMIPKTSLYWLVFVASNLVVIASLLRLTKTKWNRQYIAAFFPAVVVFSFVCNLALLEDKKSEVWKIERKTGPELYRTLIGTPDEWANENSVYYFLNEYLKSKVLITYSRDIYVQRVFQLRVAPQRIEVINYDPYLSQEDIHKLQKKPFYVEGVPGSNESFFVMGEDYRVSREIFLFRDEKMFFLVPSNALKSFGRDGNYGVDKKKSF